MRDMIYCIYTRVYLERLSNGDWIADFGRNPYFNHSPEIKLRLPREIWSKALYQFLGHEEKEDYSTNCNKFICDVWEAYCNNSPDVEVISA